MRNTEALNPIWHTIKASDWNSSDAAAASESGWNIFASPPRTLPGDVDPPFVLWRDDSHPILKCDQEADDLVRRLVEQGDRLALRARRFLQEHSHTEYLRVFKSDR